MSHQTHRGWLKDPDRGILAAVYNGAQPGTRVLTTNTALDGILLGTPVTPALAVDSLVISNMVASGDILVATNSGGNSQAWLWIDTSAGLMTLYRQGVSALELGAGVVFNEGSADRDFRVETNNLGYAIYADGGKDALVLGSNTDTSSADQLITVSRAARTATANTSYYDLALQPAGAVTVPTGTTAVVATLQVAEPNITATGTVTSAASIYVASQPTEGSTNVAIGLADDILLGLGTNADQVMVNRSTILNATTALTGVILGTPVTPAVAANSLIISNTTASGDILIAANNGGNSQAWVWVDSSAGTMTLYGAGTAVADIAATYFQVKDDQLLGIGTGNTARISWDTTDANSNQLLLQLPTAGSVDSPVLIIGQSIESVDFGAAATGADYSSVVDPTIAMFGTGAVTTGPVIEFRKGRGTVAAPTVCTTNDDLGTLDFYGAVANGEYVRSASIRADIAGTIATTRGPGTLTFLTATDAAPSVLTAALTISAAQLVTCAAGVTLTTGDLTFSAASDIIFPAATAAALELSDGTTKFYAIDTRVATVGVATHTFNISAYTLASAANAVATGWSFAAHTLNLTGNTQVTSQCDTVAIGARTIAADGNPGACTVDQANTLLITAPTEGSNVTLSESAALRIENGAGTPGSQFGIMIENLTAGATNNYALYVQGANPIRLGTGTVGTGQIQMVGTTSGVVTLSVADAAGTWTMKLPPDAGDAGEQLQTNGSGVTTWEAAGSLSQFKNVLGLHSTADALDKILGTQVVDFRYKGGRYDERGGKIVSTGDCQTVYTGVLGDEAPWAMHHGGRIFNPVSAFGYSVLGIQALHDKITALESKLAALQA